MHLSNNPIRWNSNETIGVNEHKTQQNHPAHKMNEQKCLVERNSDPESFMKRNRRSPDEQMLIYD